MVGKVDLFPLAHQAFLHFFEFLDRRFFLLGIIQLDRFQELVRSGFSIEDAFG
ncbi:hypothetical protein SDC9_161850 [bioreactor metagenome]|uniref:Uncharacterized protein n=1 Tax=bioreactor metagenome TaxID=1076179 RepID=A0A645FQQ9_9ZZZZ